MHIPHPRRLLAAIAAGGLLTLGLSVPAGAAPISQASSVATPKKGVAALCGRPKPGHASCFALVRTDIAGHAGLAPNVTPAGYGPADLASAYNIPADGGAGQTVAIVDAFDDPNAEVDLAVYRAQFGLPACSTANGCFRKVDQRGGTSYPPSNTGWAGEISLDVDMVSAIAPLAHILLVEGDDNSFDSLAASVDEAVALGAKYVSNSYGTQYSATPGSGEDPAEVTDFDPHYNHPGVAVVASSGDDDFGVSYPAASQYVTSVGGTSLVADGSARGWSESVWHNATGGPGSGCSLYEAKPAWQNDSGCGQRAVADVSAVADPETGVSVYDTFGQPGWTVFGGTSASSPIIAGAFAVAGSPVPGTYPSSYPYAATNQLNDVTDGNNGACSPAYLCTAGAGYDGPTGLGTPNGVAAFRTGPHGTLTGTVTNSATSAPVAGATVTAGDGSAVTDAAGHYTMVIPVGTYDVTASAFAFTPATTTGVAVTDGGTTTADFSLVPVPSATISGTVTDGSGHHWPLYAAITVDGVPGGPVYTDPFTGRYSLTLPQGATYDLHLAAAYPGYQAAAATAALGAADQTLDIAVPVDSAACDAPGYAVSNVGPVETFDSPSTPPGWTVTNGTPFGGWEFDDPHPRGNLTGGTGGFAIIDSDFLGSGNHEDTILTSPVTDLSAVPAPTLGFDSDYRALSSVADVDLSVDNGATWTNVWERISDARGPAHYDVPITAAGGHSQVLVRFHYTGTWAWWWEVDNVFIGARSCLPTPGGLVAGLVTDSNTHAGIVGATVTSVAKPQENATSAATPADPNLGDGFYWMLSSLTGPQTFEAAKSKYVTLSKAVTVKPDDVTKVLFDLAAGRVTLNPTSVSKTVPWGGSATQNVTVRNTGHATAHVTLSEVPGGMTTLTAHGAPATRIDGKYTPLSLKGKATGTATKIVNPAAAPWTAIADYPVPIQDNGAAVLNGKVYSAYGFNGSTDESSLYVFDPDAGTWSPLASAADTREKPAMVAVNGKIYVNGGWGASGDPDGKTEIYDPATNAWTTGAANPKPYAGAGEAVLGGKLYTVGGCTTSACGVTSVQVYDPASNSWSAGPDYPEAVSWESCGALAGRLYCAGGTADAHSLTHGYVLDGGAWSPIADLPIDLWGSAYTIAGGKLLVSGGVTGDGTALTNQGYSYDPSTGGWTALPNSNNTLYRSGSACGFYKVGGSPGGLFVPPVASSEVLPGFVDCAELLDVSWLSVTPTTLTLAPGGSATVAVKVNAGVPDITQPGTYTASLAVGTDTPYPIPAIPVSMTVNPPKTWGKITGTVTGPSGPLGGATVQINGKTGAHWTLKTDANGHYQLWLDVANNPLQVICAKDGYQPQVAKAKIAKLATTTLDFALLRA
jgi:N-acetylneuraminic acid mutarotase